MVTRSVVPARATAAEAGGAPRRPCAPAVAAATITRPTASADRRITKSLKVEITRGLRDRFLARLLERFLEPLRQRVAAALFRVHRLLERRFTARRLLRHNPVRIVELRL